MNAALEEINIQKFAITVPEDQIEYVRGAKDENLNYFLEKSQVIQIDIKEPTEKSPDYQLIAIGLHQNVEDLRTIVATHMEYFSQYQ